MAPEEIGMKEVKLMCEGGGHKTTGVLVASRKNDDPYRWRRVELKSSARIVWQTKTLQHSQPLRPKQAEELFNLTAKTEAKESSEDSYLFIFMSVRIYCSVVCVFAAHFSVVVTCELPSKRYSFGCHSKAPQFREVVESD